MTTSQVDEANAHVSVDVGFDRQAVITAPNEQIICLEHSKHKDYNVIDYYVVTGLQTHETSAYARDTTMSGYHQCIVGPPLLSCCIGLHAEYHGP